MTTSSAAGGSVMEAEVVMHEPDVLERGALCGARTKRGGVCRLPAGKGTGHPGVGQCKYHTGSTASGNRYAARLVAARIGGELDIEPEEALLLLVRRAAYRVYWWELRVSALKPEELTVSQVRERVSSGGESETVTSTSAELHIAVRAMVEAEEQLAKWAKMALDAGVQERIVRLAESVGGMFSEFFRAVFDELGLSADQLVAAPEIVARHMRLLEGPR